MALLWIEGFEGYGTSTGFAPLPAGVLARKYPHVRDATSLDIEVGRFGGFCLEMAGNSELGTPTLTVDDTLIIGFAFRVEGTTSLTLMGLWDGTDQNISLHYHQSTNELAIYRDSSILETIDIGLLPDTWYWCEMKVKTNNSTGTYDVEVGGVNIFSASGVDTQTGSNAYSSTARMEGGGTTNRWDDLYICDSTGSVNNDFLGNVRVVSISPDGDSTANFGTSTPSANHYENVDENPSDDDTSYVEDGTVNTVDLYDYEALSGAGSILGLQINTQCRETDVTAFSLITPIESNGSQYDDSPAIIGTPSYVFRSRLSELDPDTSAPWTFSGVNAAKFGIKVA
jgi:hypothetical protein